MGKKSRRPSSGKMSASKIDSRGVIKSTRGRMRNLNAALNLTIFASKIWKILQR